LVSEVSPQAAYNHMKFLKENLKYPVAAVKAKVEGVGAFFFYGRRARQHYPHRSRGKKSWLWIGRRSFAGDQQKVNLATWFASRKTRESSADCSRIFQNGKIIHSESVQRAFEFNLNYLFYFSAYMSV